jgi:hypothetical protein
VLESSTPTKTKHAGCWIQYLLVRQLELVFLLYHVGGVHVQWILALAVPMFAQLLFLES